MARLIKKEMALQHQISISQDGTNYTTMVTATNQNGNVDVWRNLPMQKARYVKLTATQVNIGYYRLTEFEVYTTDCDCDNSNAQNAAGTMKIKLYPNPGSDFLIYDLQTFKPGVSYNIVIRSIEGKLIQSFKSEASYNSINIKSLSRGAYLFSIYENKILIASQKFIKN
jgi:hypothetical protein